MRYQLVFTERPLPGKDVGDNVFLDDLPSAYKVYVFYYAGAMPNEAMENALRNLGRSTGQNLFVNIGKLNDPHYDKIASLFGLRRFPVVVVTAAGGLTGADLEYLSAYVRLDNEHLLDSPERAAKCVQELYNLFIQGKIAAAISRAKGQQRTETLRWLMSFLGDALTSLQDFVAERDLSISFAEGKFELKKSGG